MMFDPVVERVVAATHDDCLPIRAEDRAGIGDYLLKLPTSCIFGPRPRSYVANKIDGSIHVFFKTSLGIIVNDEIKPATVYVAGPSGLASCLVYGDPDAFHRFGPVLCQSLSNLISHGSISALPFAFSVPSPLIYQSRNHRPSFHL